MVLSKFWLCISVKKTYTLIFKVLINFTLYLAGNTD
jgi:hypothetical protein